MTKFLIIFALISTGTGCAMQDGSSDIGGHDDKDDSFADGGVQADGGEESFERGEELYVYGCANCHQTSVAGAPKFADFGSWSDRVDRPRAELYMHAIDGFSGRDGIMPPKGGFSNASGLTVVETVDFMIAAVGGSTAPGYDPDRTEQGCCKMRETTDGDWHFVGQRARTCVDLEWEVDGADYAAEDEAGLVWFDSVCEP